MDITIVVGDRATLLASIAANADAIAAEPGARNTAIAAAIVTEVDNRNTAIAAAASAEATARGTAITAAVSAEASARNTAITSAVSAEAATRSTAITGLSDDLAAETESRELLAATVDGELATKAAISDLARTTGRPGDAPLYFTGSLAGDASAGIGAPGVPAVNDSGAVQRVTGGGADGGIVATRECYDVEPGRAQEFRWSVERVTDPSDPSGDTVRFAVQPLDNNKGLLGASIVVFGDGSDPLKVVDGRLIRKATFALAGVDGVDHVLPAGTCYTRPFIQNFGADGVTDDEIIKFADVTDRLASQAAGDESVGAVAAGLTTEVGRATTRENAIDTAKLDKASVASHGDMDAGTATNLYATPESVAYITVPIRSDLDNQEYAYPLNLVGPGSSPIMDGAGRTATLTDPISGVQRTYLRDATAPLVGPGSGHHMDRGGRSSSMVDPVSGEMRAMLRDVTAPVIGSGSSARLSRDGRVAGHTDALSGTRRELLDDATAPLIGPGSAHHLGAGGRVSAYTDRLSGVHQVRVGDVNAPVPGRGRFLDAGGRALTIVDPLTGEQRLLLRDSTAPLIGPGGGHMDGNGHQAFVVKRDGTMILPDCTVNRNAPFLPIQTVDGEYGYGLAVIDTNGRKVAIDFDSGRNIPLLIDGFSAMTATYLNRQGATTATKIVSLLSSTTISSGVDTLHVFVADGQSKALIGNAISATHTTAQWPGRALMLGPAPATWEGHADGNSTPPLDSFFVGLNDLVEVANAGGNLGETPWTAIATTLLPTYPANEGIVVSTFSVSGQSYAPDTSTGTTYYGLRRGTNAWEMMRRGMLSIARGGLLAGRKMIFEGFFIGTGQTDSTIGTTQPQELNYLLEWQRNAAALAHATFGPDADTRFYMIVANDIGGTNADPYRAMIQAARLYPDRFVIVAADYQFARIDGTHYTILAQDELGELLANARIALKAGGVPTTMIRKAVRTGATIKLGFDVPVGPIAIDTVTIADPGHAGFSYVQTAGTAQTISTVAVTGAREITITLSGDPGTPSYEEITYALPAAGGHGSGCVRDSATAVSTFDNTFHLYNWAPPQWLPVETF